MLCFMNRNIYDILNMRCNVFLTGVPTINRDMRKE